jgi:cytochrome c peroxidase
VGIVEGRLRTPGPILLEVLLDLRALVADDKDALSVSEQRGLELFRGRAQCVECHVVTESEASLADGKYHSLGLDLDRIALMLAALTGTVAALSPEEVYRRISSDADRAALGRFAVTRRQADIGKFKTPSLRNVADTALYMHDGSLPTLEAALDRELYYRGKAQGHPVVLSLAERNDLLAFLRALKDTPRSPEGNRSDGRLNLLTEK